MQHPIDITVQEIIISQVWVHHSSRDHLGHQYQYQNDQQRIQSMEARFLCYSRAASDNLGLQGVVSLKVSIELMINGVSSFYRSKHVETGIFCESRVCRAHFQSTNPVIFASGRHSVSVITRDLHFSLPSKMLSKRTEWQRRLGDCSFGDC